MDIVSAVMGEHSRPSLFSNTGRGYSGWSTAKSAFDRRMKEAGSAIAAWRLHDIRRTVATRLADLGALPHIVEAVLNHVSGHKSGVAGVYNRAAYAKEKREVLDLWADHLQVLIAGLQPVARDN
jgi:integrase